MRWKWSAAIVFLIIVSCSEPGDKRGWSKSEDKVRESIEYSETKFANANDTFFQVIKSVPVPAELNFAGERVPLENPDVLERLEFELFSNCFKHSKTAVIIKRAYRWRGTIEQILEEKKIPKDFFYLAIAESELSNKAKSGVGAMGMWQFMKSTGKEYNLKINNYIDERRHPEKATYAACQYLADGYNRFENWTLVAASYNMGRAGLSKRLKDQQVNSFYDTYLFNETARYVFRILAFKLILENPERYGFFIDNNELYAPFKYQEVVVEKTIDDLAQFAKDHGTNYKELRRLNPWFNNTSNYRLHITKSKPLTLKVPITKFDHTQMADTPHKDTSHNDTIYADSIPAP